MSEVSPWWYRGRGSVFLAIYLVAIFAGNWIWSFWASTKIPMYAWLASKLGVSQTLVLACATALMIGCWAVRCWGSSYLSASVVWSPHAKTDALLVDGPFRYVRNPLYLGNMLMALAIGTLFTPAGFVIVVAGSAVFVAILARYEAAKLYAKYGAIFETYRSMVPALVPRLSPARVEGSMRGSAALRQGLRAEIFTASLAIGMILLTILPQHNLTAPMLLWIVGYFAQTFSAMRSAR